MARAEVARPERQGDVFWLVRAGGQVVKGGLTNAQAWRLADKINREPLNKRQETSDWAFNKQANEGSHG